MRGWPGWQHHLVLCLLASAFLLTLQQEWGEKMPGVTRPQVHRIVYELLPRKRYTEEELLFWLERTPTRNAAARASHARRRQRHRAARDSLPAAFIGPSL